MAESNIWQLAITMNKNEWNLFCFHFGLSDKTIFLQHFVTDITNRISSKYGQLFNQALSTINWETFSECVYIFSKQCEHVESFDSIENFE